MDIETLWLTIRSAVSLVTVGTMIAFMVQRNIKQFRETNAINYARMLMAFSFFSSWISHILLLGVHGLGIEGMSFLIGTSLTEITLNTTLIATTIMFSAMFAAYINKWDSLVLLPLFFQIGAIIMTILLNINFEMYYIFTFGSVSIIALFQAGIKVKDNMALGMGIMSLIQLIASFGGFWFQTSMSLISTAFGAITIAGLFRPFGRQL
ncbi:MAG: hypothetical protein ACTSRE_12105 [Promethearchaeota archaeon]